ncbi:tRNA dihydrouridine synthase DusB [Salinarimonas soli]|uniref:tRNA-dihydrouridine synthase n=1 Tax=Salinarimonas soli TaxID=1638099 RepID=A0A5B2VFK3_9HYPH|nr:tRNA dihydrouridine synthase DusB [Salinarimonas soli]KAA2237635.1 tRNA dihydrouridine synthase DusB [Salinarimonas soli]
MSVDQKLGDPLVIGSVVLDGRAILAPLSGVTDVVVRRIARRFGASLVVSEMVACDDYVRGAEEARLRAEGEGVTPHVVQLAGCDAHWMERAARLACDAGADIIDINMGCPAKRVTGGWAGSALMRDLDHAAALIEAVVRAVRIPVTVKMRLGWDERMLNAPELARRAAEAGAAAVTVHGRTRQQFYKGSADWSAIAPVAAGLSIPLVANGDVTSLDDARRCLAQSGADAVMIGRAAMGRPWLVGQIASGLAGRPVREPDAAEKTAAAVEHYEGLLSLYGARMGVRHARKHLAAYADEAGAAGYGLAEADRAALVRMDDPAAVVALLRRLYAEPVRRAA